MIDRLAEPGSMQIGTMIKRAMTIAAAVFAVACNSGPSPGSSTNTVGGANVVSSAQTPMVTKTSDLALNWGKKAKPQPGQVALADVITYGGKQTTITPPAGWKLIREDSSPTTRQSLYWHPIQANDPGAWTWTFTPAVDAQGALVLLGNAAADSPVDMSNGQSGTGGAVKSESMTTTADGDLILIFKATDFSRAPMQASIPGDMAAVVKQDQAPDQFWIVATYQDRNGATEETDFQFPQLFNWVAAQVAIKHGSQ
jgi:hypothetical protein